MLEEKIDRLQESLDELSPKVDQLSELLGRHDERINGVRFAVAWLYGIVGTTVAGVIIALVTHWLN